MKITESYSRAGRSLKDPPVGYSKLGIIQIEMCTHYCSKKMELGVVNNKLKLWSPISLSGSPLVPKARSNQVSCAHLDIGLQALPALFQSSGPPVGQAF